MGTTPYMNIPEYPAPKGGNQGNANVYILKKTKEKSQFRESLLVWNFPEF